MDMPRKTADPEFKLIACVLLSVVPLQLLDCSVV